MLQKIKKLFGLDKNKNTLLCKKLKEYRIKSKYHIKITQTPNSYPNYVLVRMIWNGESYSIIEELYTFTPEEFKDVEKMKKILSEHRRDYIIDVLLKEDRIEYGKFRCHKKLEQLDL